MLSTTYKAMILSGCLLLTSLSVYAFDSQHPAVLALGERLFLETRFAQFYFAHGQGGDPVVDQTLTRNGHLPGPFSGQSMNCASCHLVDQHFDTQDGGMRGYADFARRSPLPEREDGLRFTVRNSPTLINLGAKNQVQSLFHFDGEFSQLLDLVKDTYSGRNYGWLADERALAIQHIAAIVRQDDGLGSLASEFGGSYRMILSGMDQAIPEEFRLPERFRVDVDQLSDVELFEHIAGFTVAYIKDLQFSQDRRARFNGSPYDLFLKLNRLPRKPRRGESDLDYSLRLLRRIKSLQKPVYVDKKQGTFITHKQDFKFGPLELRGMKLFFANPVKRKKGRAGQCISCHMAPHFTDSRPHNTGLSQFEYDQLHGPGAFNEIYIPTLQERNRSPQEWLPKTADWPFAKSPFRAIADTQSPGLTDLGVWNIFANEQFPQAQQALWKTLCLQQVDRLLSSRRLSKQLLTNGLCQDDDLLSMSVASFKTPGLRNLGHSAPYMHNGMIDDLESVVDFYRDMAKLARRGKLRNADPVLSHIHLTRRDSKAIAAFLRSLNEDYQ